MTMVYILSGLTCFVCIKLDVRGPQFCSQQFEVYLGTLLSWLPQVSPGALHVPWFSSVSFLNLLALQKLLQSAQTCWGWSSKSTCSPCCRSFIFKVSFLHFQDAWRSVWHLGAVLCCFSDWLLLLTLLVLILLWSPTVHFLFELIHGSGYLWQQHLVIRHTYVSVPTGTTWLVTILLAYWLNLLVHCFCLVQSLDC